MSGCAASKSAITFSIAGLVVASAEAQFAKVIVTVSAARAKGAENQRDPENETSCLTVRGHRASRFSTYNA